MDKSRYCPGRYSLRLIKEKQHCEQCDTLQLCSNTWLDKELISDIDQITLDRGTFQTGQAIFHMEDRFRSFFTIQSGSVKVEKTLEDGTKHVNGFFFTGDLFGLDSIGKSLYEYDAIALETTRICEIAYDKIELLSSSIPRLQKLFISLLGNKVHQTNNLLIDGRYLSAEKRLLLFLKSLCERNLVHIKSNKGRLNLTMTKADIASYLGLRPESVSRALTNLQKQGVIRNYLKYIEINDISAAMRAICKS
jgi:CRP/FNR family transcriptional regulator